MKWGGQQAASWVARRDAGRRTGQRRSAYGWATPRVGHGRFYLKPTTKLAAGLPLTDKRTSHSPAGGGSLSSMTVVAAGSVTLLREVPGEYATSIVRVVGSIAMRRTSISLAA